MLLHIQLSNWCGVISLSLYGLCKLAQAVSCLTVLPRSSNAPIPCEVAENCHSALTPKSYLWWYKSRKFLLFFYCGIAPSEKHIIFLGCNLASSNSFRKAIKELWKSKQLQYHGGDSQKSPQSSHGVYPPNPSSRWQRDAGLFGSYSNGTLGQHLAKWKSIFQKICTNKELSHLQK